VGWCWLWCGGVFGGGFLLFWFWGFCGGWANTNQGVWGVSSQVLVFKPPSGATVLTESKKRPQRFKRHQGLQRKASGWWETP